MKRILLGMIIIAVLMLVGCNNVATNKQLDSISNPTSSPPISPSSSPSISPSSSPTNYVKTYKDETQKKLQYGKLSINFDKHHIVSDTFSNNTETFKCELDKGKVPTEANMTITIREIRKQDFLNRESIISYLSDISPNYTAMRIYNDVNDNSGIIDLYTVTGGGLTNYLVCYRDACYLIESDYSTLNVYLFKNFIKANYEAYKEKIECANSFIADVNETNYHDDNKVIYDIIQSKDGEKYSAELSYNEKEFFYNFTLKKEKGETLLILSTHASDFDGVIKILDINMDGYADIQFLSGPGAMNNSYDLYVWDDSADNFVKVKCDEMLSYFEVHDGYFQNWTKAGADSGIIQKFVWNGNTLIKESEETYHID